MFFLHSIAAAIDRWRLARAARGRSAERAGRDPLGPAGERAAARYLRSRRYRLLGMNVRVPPGEADLVCLGPDRTTIVIVEVKTRRVEASVDGTPPSTTGTPGFQAPPPEAAVDHRKRRKLVAVGRYLVSANRWHRRPVRVDVIGIDWPTRGKPVIRHHAGVLMLTVAAARTNARG